MMSWGNNIGTAGWVASGIGMLVIVAVVIGVIAWLLSRSRDVVSTHGQTAESAKEILDRRLASGEITVAQYNRLRDTFEPRQPQ